MGLLGELMCKNALEQSAVQQDQELSPAHKHWHSVDKSQGAPRLSDCISSFFTNLHSCAWTSVECCATRFGIFLQVGPMCGGVFAAVLYEIGFRPTRYPVRAVQVLLDSFASQAV